MTNYKIVIYTKPIFDKQYKFQVFDNTGNADKWVCSGNTTKAKLKKELDYWFNKK